MKHKHHIIPRHAGGSNDPSNIVELTIEEHAEAHRLLYEEHGKYEDWIAWKGLSGQIGKEEWLQERSRAGGMKGKPHTEEHKKKISEALKARTQKRVLSEEHKEKISLSMKGHRNSKNHSSEEYKKKQSEAMKRAWAKRKSRSMGKPG